MYVVIGQNLCIYSLVKIYVFTHWSKSMHLVIGQNVSIYSFVKIYVFTQTLCLEQDMTQGQFFILSTTDLDSEFFFPRLVT